MSSSVREFEDVRRRAESRLSISGLAQDVKADVQTMANVPLPLSEKYSHIKAKTMVMENATRASRQENLESLSKLFKALSILEKYGCNLTSPCRPKFWRSVKHNNPVFRTTVDAAQGGRAVLYLYGYTNQQPDGLSFPEDVTDPDVEKVAAVTVEVMTLRLELDMMIKGAHPHPEAFIEIIPSLSQEDEVVSDAVVILPGEEGGERQKDHLHPTAPLKSTTHTAGECNLCGGVPTLLCPSCASTPFCDSCDHLYHRHPSRANHKRERIQDAMKDTCSICGTAPVSTHCSTCIQKLCLNCDRLFHSHPDRGDHDRTMVSTVKPQGAAASPSFSSWECGHCTTVNPVQAVLCGTCERPRLANAASSGEEDLLQSPSNTEWQCKSCTVMNQGTSVLCEVCERPRLATRPPVTPVAFPSLASGLPGEGATEVRGPKWICQVCTYQNSKPSVGCEMCNSPCKDPAVAKSLLSPKKDLSPPRLKPLPAPRDNDDLKRQETMREQGLALVSQIREGEKRGVTPEEVYASLRVSGGSSVNPCDWLQSELPHLLDEICAMAASVQQNYKTEHPGMQDNTEKDDGGIPGTLGCGAPGAGIQLSRAEAKQAWLAAGGDTEKAVRQLLRDRQAKIKELRSMGFREVSQCEEALRQSGGEVRGALSLLQRPLLEPFHQRIWTNQPEALLDPKDPDKQKLCRRLLALYDLPSWGRCELALSLLQEPDAQYSLEDVVQAVRESQDRDFLRRLLNKTCPCCYDVFPHSKMQSLTSCQCAVCHHCFKQHFTVAIRDKHIRDMVCPICQEPDINNPQHLDSYFSTLDIQLKGCLERDVYDLYHKKLTEHTLMMDPKFLWCCHCTFGFIFDGELKVTCPGCHKSFCAQCKKPWEVQHKDLSCEQFQRWKKENDPEYQKQGLTGFLRDNGITCPQCKFQYVLSRGGCMHFTCVQCAHQFCSGCNNPYYTTKCKTGECKLAGLHAHHPRDCLSYLRDWDPERLQTLLQRNVVEFNTDPPNGTQTDECGVMEQKDEGGQQTDSHCGIKTKQGHAGLCEKHYKEYLVSLINGHSLDPAVLYDVKEVEVACARYEVDHQRVEAEEDQACHARLLKKLMEVPLGENVPRKK
ncbi:E3 ubiquitin-protein ligase RNF31-like isoform X1 [Osmerus eperlanus]|uniref:E3 ubiquitin-protein ligase RNF31-like isoform X1 n=1 Tax=Osmerus eperlanus TaxID=29151 RepID=UPI002E11D505